MTDQALADATEAIRLAPSDAQLLALAYNERGLCLANKGAPEKAIADYDEAIRLDPKYADAFFNRGGVWYHKKEYDKAIADYDEAIRLDPANSGASNSRAWLLATCPDDKIRDGKKAVEAAKKACVLTDYKTALFLRTLAAACAEAGDFDEALKWQTKALEDVDYEKRYGDDAHRLLKLYQDHKPYREET